MIERVNFVPLTALPKKPLLAWLRMGKKYFIHRVQPEKARPSEVLVEVIRVKKDLSPGSPLGPVSFPCRRHRCCYYLWDQTSREPSHLRCTNAGLH